MSVSRNKIADLLSQHAEALQAGGDPGDELLAANPERRGALAGLFALAGRVRAALAPVEPPPDFVADLKRQLVANADRARAVTRRERTEQRRALVVAAGAGGAVYALGLVALALRAGLSLAALLAALIRRRGGGPPQSTSAGA
jgi:hypothetical protein